MGCELSNARKRCHRTLARQNCSCRRARAYAELLPRTAVGDAVGHDAVGRLMGQYRGEAILVRGIVIIITIPVAASLLMAGHLGGPGRVFEDTMEVLSSDGDDHVPVVVDVDLCAHQSYGGILEPPPHPITGPELLGVVTATVPYDLLGE